MKLKTNTYQIIIERIKQVMKANKEYKVNFYSILFFDIILLGTYLLFYQIYSKFVGEIIGWNSYDFILYYFALYFGSKGKWLFSLQYFTQRLLRGDLNTILTKPVNPFLFENLKIVNGPTLILMPISFLLFLIVAIKGNYSNIFLGSLILIFGTILEIIMINFLESLAFFIKNNRFLLEMFFHTIYINEEYTPKVFEKISNLFYLLTTSIYGYFVVEILKSKFNLFIKFIPLILIFYSIIVFLTFIIWKIGLKKYEAYS
jgi:ABC-type uncharacterized transport system permease subunit